MITKHRSFLSSNGRHRIQALIWEPQDTPVGILQINYGMAEYAKRYQDVAQFFTAQGFIVACHDHLGHGQTVRSVKEFGYFGPEGKQALVEDSHLWTMALQQAYPKLPLYLLGHSMGSLITEQYLQKYWYDTNGTILMGTVYQPKILPALMPEIRLRAKLQGKRPDYLLNALAFGPYNLKFDHREFFSWLSSDPAAVARYKADPLLGFTFTTNGFETLFELVLAQETNQWTQNLPAAYPILVTSGAQDPVGDFGRQPAKLVAALQNKGLEKVTKKEWPALRHEPLFEVDTAAVEAYLAHWLWQQLEQGSV
ncbi:alpha/beta fold hydrolase [Agrilactobacillus yilanensis]|nr:alpha/beta hydrolase [Agrilactobacillus yilanensis]